MANSNKAIKKVEEKFQHPELEPGEVFVNNFMPDRFYRFNHLKSARMGKKVYDERENEIPGVSWRPVFLSKDDYAKYQLHLKERSFL